MCGIDWDAVLAQYRPLVERVASPDEFADLLREVLGELGTSHAYVTAARRNEGPPHYQRARACSAPTSCRQDGRWTLARILPGDSSDSKARSPLAGTGIREGAVLTHVDGRPVDPVTGPYPLLAGAGGTTVELTFRPDGGRGPRPPGRRRPADRRTAAALPGLGGQTPGCRTGVEQRAVRLLHIPDMGGSGWAPTQVISTWLTPSSVRSRATEGPCASTALTIDRPLRVGLSTAGSRWYPATVSRRAWLRC